MAWTGLRVQSCPSSRSGGLFPYTTLFRSSRVAVDRCLLSVTNARTATAGAVCGRTASDRAGRGRAGVRHGRSEEHTSELQSHSDLVCRLLLEKKNITGNLLIRMQRIK